MKKKGGMDYQKISQKSANLNYVQKSANLQIFENDRIWLTSNNVPSNNVPKKFYIRAK